MLAGSRSVSRIVDLRLESARLKFEFIRSGQNKSGPESTLIHVFSSIPCWLSTD